MAIDPTPTAELDRAVEELAANRDRFARTSIRERIALIDQMSRDTYATANAQVRAACRAKRIPVDGPQSSEEWLGGPMTTLRNLRLLKKSLLEIEQTGAPTIKDSWISTRSNGQVTVRVTPSDFADHVLAGGMKADVWLEPTVARSDLMNHVATTYRGSRPEGKTALVLGAGNVASIGPMDVLYKMFVENQVCVLKMNPVNEYTGPYVEQGFRAAIDAGYLRVVYGGAAEGAYLCAHDLVDEVHITGSDYVHDLIVWGSPDEQAQRKADNNPVLTKRMTSELGCVTPIIVTPGEWSRSELDYWATYAASMLANNASFNCNAAKVLLTSANWPQRGAFLAKTKDILRTVAPRDAYYPGAAERHASFVEAYPQTETIGNGASGSLPWAIATGVDIDGDPMAFTREAWCAFIAEAPIDASDPADFLAKATAFANDKMWGTLSCSLVIDDRTRRNNKSAYEQAVADLRYGTVAVNAWAAFGYGLVTTPWGAHSGHTLDDIQSGIGMVHNTFMFENIQKSVIRSPFQMKPNPPLFVTSKRPQVLAQRLTDFEATGRLRHLPRVAVSALMG